MEIYILQSVYLISTLGKIKNSSTNRILKVYKQKDGYVRVKLYKNGKSKVFSVHRLIASHFISNPNNYPTVDHIDNDRSNNKLSNLRWASYSQQARNIGKRGRLTRKVSMNDTNTGEVIQIYGSIKEAAADIPGSDHRLISMVCRNKRKTHAGYSWKYVDTESYSDEKWVNIREYDGFCVSNYGRIKFKDGRITPGHNSNGYRRIHLKRKDGTESHKMVHILVARHFIPSIDGKNFVNHKDGNRQNNTVRNLEWCSRNENCKHAYETGLNRSTRKIRQLNIKNNTTKTFESIQEASNTMDIPYHRIWQTLVGRRTDKKYEWSYY